MAKFFFCVFIDRDGVEVHKLAKRRTRPLSSHFDRTSLSIKYLLYGFRENFSCGTWRVALSGQDSPNLPARVPNHSAGLIFLAFSRSWPYNRRSLFPREVRVKTKATKTVRQRRSSKQGCGSNKRWNSLNSFETKKSLETTRLKLFFVQFGWTTPCSKRNFLRQFCSALHTSVTHYP